MTNTYADPVAKLLKLGRPTSGNDWQDYSVLGITREDIPELLRLIQDDDLRFLDLPEDLPDNEDVPEWYAQIHAWRALAQLKAEEAIPVILGILRQVDDEDDDWLSSDAPIVFGIIGPAAIEPLKEYLANDDNPMYARSTASTSLAEIGNRHPKERERCIQGIVSVLEKYETNDEGLNGFLINDLIGLKAVEQIELIKKAFEANAVDEFVNGDVEDVQIEMGLLEKRLTPERPLRFKRFSSELDEFSAHVPKSNKAARKAAKKEKNKRKQEKKSRKKNRKRK